MILHGLTFCGIAGWLLSASSGFNCGGKSRAYTTAVKSDLRNLTSAQEAFFASNGRYARSLDEMSEHFRSSSGVTIAIVAADARHWSARGAHAALEGSCTASSTDRDLPKCDLDGRRSNARPERLVANISVDLWLFAFSFARWRSRRRRRELDATGDTNWRSYR